MLRLPPTPNAPTADASGPDAPGPDASAPDAPGPANAWRIHLRGPAPEGPLRLRLAGTLRHRVFARGVCLGRGPAAFHPGEVPVEEHAIEAGRLDELALETWDHDVATVARVPDGTPWLALALVDESGRDRLVDAVFWRARDAGFRGGSPRRTPVLDPVDLFDAAAAPPPEWREPGFAPEGWVRVTPEPMPEDPAWLARPVPRLRHREVLGAGPQHAFAADAPAETFEALGADAPARAATAVYAASLERATGGCLGGAGGLGGLGQESPGPVVAPGPGPTRVEGLSPGRGVQLVFDLGAEWVGEPLLTISSDSAGTADVGFVESLHADGRPRLLMKGGSYANRVHARPGRTRYESTAYSGFRWVSVMLRGFTGAVSIEKIGVRTGEADVRWPAPGEVKAPLPGLQPAVDLSVRTQRLGVQETLLDCPTREQAMYIGDGHPMGRWMFRLTGDARQWRRLVRAQFARPARSGPLKGLVRTVVFSARWQMLLDYELIAITGTADYLRHTGDVETVRAVLPAARGVYGWFEGQLDAEGFCAVEDARLPRQHGREHRFEPDAVSRDRNARLFIDHAGIGWHNVGEPGIDRRGLNAALQAYLCVTERALAELEDAAGRPERAEELRARATARAAAAGPRFFDPAQNAFADGFFEGQRLGQVSQQTNVWAALAGFFGRGDVPDAAAVLGPLFDAPPEGTAVCGPYFWVYAVEALREAGLVALLHREMQRLWQPMIDAGATSLWESFNGDDLDSRCHPWSGAPIDAALGPWPGRES